MDQRNGTVPGDRGTAGRTSVGRAHIRARLLVIALVLGLGGAAVAGVPFQPPPEVEAAAPPPGVQPEVQKWFKLREKSQIELNDALLPVVQKGIEKPGAAPAACRRLATVTKVMLKGAAAPHPKVDQLSRAGLAKFDQGAAACLAGDLATAERLVAEGLAERTAAQEPLDEVLDGD
jgi:hypothetical protein